MYQVRRVHIGKTAQLDELSHECGMLYSHTLVFFWRTVRHKGIWLKEKHLKRLFTSKKLHAHTADACVEAVFASLKSWWRRRKKLIRSKQQQLAKIKQQIRDIEHKQTTRLITTLHQAGVRTLAIGDVRDIRQDNDVGSTNNQKIHQWSHGTTRHMLTYKAQRLGISVLLQEERYTSKTCPACGHRRKSAAQGRMFRRPKCKWTYHRDGVGAINIRAKYREEFGSPHVVGRMAHPTSMRYYPHTGVARGRLREAAEL